MRKLVALMICVLMLVPVAVYGEGKLYSEYPVLKKGVSGPEVRLLQQALKLSGHFQGVETTLFFGDVTDNAVRAYQASQNMTADGVVGQKTLESLDSNGFIPMLQGTLYKPGALYDDLPILQAALHSEGCFTGTFGKLYDEPTLAAVDSFQRRYGLTPDGIAGKATLLKLTELGYLADPTAAVSPGEGIAVSRGGGKRSGLPIDWYSIKPKLSAGKTVLTLEDHQTGVSFRVQVSYAATVHADIETLTPEDTEIVRKLWGGFSWDRRPVLVHLNGEVYAASMNGLPHAGVDAEPEGITVNGRSGGYGRGYNFDDVKGNGIDGHFCLHFVNSRTHGSNQIDAKHQANIRIAAGQ